MGHTMGQITNTVPVTCTLNLLVHLLLALLCVCCRLHRAHTVSFVARWGAFDHVVEPVATWIDPW
jgi:hypothetical protein